MLEALRNGAVVFEKNAFVVLVVVLATWAELVVSVTTTILVIVLVASLDPTDVPVSEETPELNEALKLTDEPERDKLLELVALLASVVELLNRVLVELLK